jgi:hypothetical protein
MQPSRDSSVWRSLAVAFGDGLAFGVGVKLTQAATARSADAALAEPNIAPLADRLEQFERRLALMEQAPAALPPAPAPFDQKVLEAVVNALDARLREQAGQVEKRLASLESKMAAELKVLREQDHAIGSAVENHVEELQDHFIGYVEGIRLQVEHDRATMRQEVAEAVAVAKDRQIDELRRKVEENDIAMTEFLNGIGELIRHAGSRKTVAAEAIAATPVEPEQPAAPPADPAGIEDPLPAFAQPGKPGRLWRVPLVSSMVIATWGVVMMHYL